MTFKNSSFVVGNSEENGEIICEHFEKNITCPYGQVIKVENANYGRTSQIPCQNSRKYITTNCKASNSLQKTKEICEGKRTCILRALNTVYGNPCPGVIKYLEFRFQCVNSPNSEMAKENTVAVNGLNQGDWGTGGKFVSHAYSYVCVVCKQLCFLSAEWLLLLRGMFVVNLGIHLFIL